MQLIMIHKMTKNIMAVHRKCLFPLIHSPVVGKRYCVKTVMDVTIYSTQQQFTCLCNEDDSASSCDTIVGWEGLALPENTLKIGFISHMQSQGNVNSLRFMLGMAKNFVAVSKSS